MLRFMLCCGTECSDRVCDAVPVGRSQIISARLLLTWLRVACAHKTWSPTLAPNDCLVHEWNGCDSRKQLCREPPD